jgi:iron complex outermembrane receptor protein
VGTVAPPPQLAAYSSVLLDRIEERRIECGQPHDSLRLGGNWARKRADLDLSVERFGTFSSVESANPADDQLYGAKWLTDLEGLIHNSTVNSFNRIETFPRHSPFAMNGRSVYARIGYVFN